MIVPKTPTKLTDQEIWDGPIKRLMRRGKGVVLVDPSPPKDEFTNKSMEKVCGFYRDYDEALEMRDWDERFCSGKRVPVVVEKTIDGDLEFFISDKVNHKMRRKATNIVRKLLKP